ncbi:hypothetical protein BGZ47_002430 [Haplosporangium gracile]|nr:hypothetical protein BGZ47_002430 [Haplosporangium gracile]
MAYPTYRAKDVNIPKLDNVSGFFDRNPPANWTPLKFAHDPETLSLDDFTNDLKVIKEMGRNRHNAYAGECYRDTFESRGLDQAQTAMSPDLVKSAYNTESTKLNQKLSPPKRSSAEVVLELESASAPDQERPTKKVAFQDDVFSSEGGSDYVDSNPSSTRSSLNSIDFKYIDHLVGPGTTSSRLKTSSRLIVSETNVSEVAMNARRNILKKQSEIVGVSDLLTINFIFDAEFLRKHLPATISESLLNNEDTYTQSLVKCIIFGIVEDLDIVDHWSRDRLPTPHGFEELYFPDYYAEFDGLPLFVVEIKKPGAVDDNLEGDKRKVPCMMKLVLDTLLNVGVSAPSVLGLQIRDSRCEVSTISLDNEALYIHRIIGVFELPKNNLQLGLLGPAISPLKFARVSEGTTYRFDVIIVDQSI